MTFDSDISEARPSPGVTVDKRDRIVDAPYEPDTGRSNFAAFLLGGVVVSGGMLAFLYYDNATTIRRDDITTGSIVRSPEMTVPNVRVPAEPRAPSRGSSEP